MVGYRRDGKANSAGRSGRSKILALRFASAVLVSLALGACEAMPEANWISGFAPIYTKTVHGGGHKDTVNRTIAPEVVSLQPTLGWRPFPGAEAYPHDRTPFIAVDPARLGKVGYDLRVWRRDQGMKELVYERYGIEGPSHRFETPLQPGALYLWTVRARFKVDGKENLSEWSMALWPPVRPPGMTNVSNWGGKITEHRNARVMARQFGSIPDANLFKFRTPNDASLVARAAVATETRVSGATSAPEEPPLRPRREVEAYLERNRAAVRQQLAVYNKAYGLVPVPGIRGETVTEIQSLEVKELYGKDALVEIAYEVRDDRKANSGRHRFELAWQGDALVFVGHRPIQEAAAAVAPAEQPKVVSRPAAAPPLRSMAHVRTYLVTHRQKIRDELTAYNDRHRLVVHPQGASLETRKITIDSFEIVELYGSTVVTEIAYDLDSLSTRFEDMRGRYLFELEWLGGDLVIVGHRPATETGASDAARARASAARAAAPPLRSMDQVRTYLATHRQKIRDQLAAYNDRHRLVVHPQGGINKLKEIHSLELEAAYGSTVELDIAYAVGTAWNEGRGRYLFETEWLGGELVFVGHRPATEAGASDAARVRASAARAAAAPLRSRQEVRAYLQDNGNKILQKLSSYNRQHRVVVAQKSVRVTRIFSYQIEDLVGDTVVVAIDFVVGVEGSNQEAAGQNLFELKWVGGELEVVGHRPT